MAAFLGLSIWFALVTVIPGLVTIAVIWGAVVVVVEPPPDALSISGLADSTLAIGAAVTIMLITQWLGVLLEEKVLVPRRWLGNKDGAEREIQAGIDPAQGDALKIELTMDPYDEYDGLYLLLAELRQEDDVHGHLERAITQFFLTVNTLVAFAIGIVTTVTLVAIYGFPQASNRAIVYPSMLAMAFVTTWWVAVSRFELMGWSVAAARRRRAREFQREDDHGSSPSRWITPRW